MNLNLFLKITQRVNGYQINIKRSKNMNLSQKNKIPNLIFVDELGMFPELRKL
jgi:translation initiation factor IF-2